MNAFLQGSAFAAPQLGQDRPVLAVVKEYTVANPSDPYLTLRALAQYSGCSVRWLRYRVADPHQPIPCYRLPGGKILVRRSEFDAWIGQYRTVGLSDVEQIVGEVLAKIA